MKRNSCPTGVMAQYRVLISPTKTLKRSPWQKKVAAVQDAPEDVTVPRVAIFRDAIVDLFDMELGTRHCFQSWRIYNDLYVALVCHLLESKLWSFVTWVVLLATWGSLDTLDLWRDILGKL